MADSGRLDELKRKFDENPRRYFAPLANEYRKAGDTDRAIELCRTYLPQQPNHMSGYIVYGQALFDAGRGEEAAAVFKQALTLDPENIIALRYLGDVARVAGDSAGAMCWYGKVLELDPRNEEMANRITELASPSTRKTPRNERIAPPTVRPEPEYDASAVALAQLVSEPDKPQPEIARPVPAPEQERPPVLVLEESFQIISWPIDAQPQPTGAENQTETGGEDQLSTPTQQADRQADEQTAERVADPVHEAVAEPVVDQSSELVYEEPGDQEHDRTLEQEARSFADFLPDEPAPLAPAEQSFFDVTSVLHLTTTPAHADADDDGETGADPADSDAAGPESPFVTETMAELYVQQGLADDALIIYRQLVLRRPDPRLHRRIAELEGRNPGDEAAPESAPEAVPETAPEHATSAAGEETPARADMPPATAHETVQEFFARIGAAKAQSHAHIAAENEGGLAAIFGSSAGDAADLSAAQSVAGAFGSGRAGADSPRD